MAKVKEISKIEMISNLLQEALTLSKEEYQTSASNPLSSIIVDLELTILEVNKIK
jgi:hypothetical protein